MAEPVSDLKAEAQDYLNKHQVIGALESAVNDLMKDKPSEPFGYLADKLTELVPVARPEVVFVLGGPGSGKGTQCANIVREYGFVHLSAGDLLRDERKSGGETGSLIDKYIVEGKIVPVEITVGLLKKAMEKQILRGNTRFLIDGFPRNQDNLQGWERVMGGFATVRFVLYFDCPEEVMEKRLLKRGETSGRTDDNIESIKKRFRVFITETTPVIASYEKKGMVKKVNSDRSPDEVFALIRNIFDVFFKTGEVQTTFVLIKPDAFTTHREAILLKIHQANFAVVAKQRVHIKRALAVKLFGDDEKQITHVTSGPSLALALRLESGIKRFLTLAGPTDPEQAKKSHAKSLRALFGTDPIRNAVYCSADLETANRDLEAFFPSNLFLNYIPKRIIIAGAPASGKGTQCEFITAKYGVVHLSTGDLLREAAKNGTELGLKAKGFMEKGQLVPDDLVIGFVKEKLESKEVKERGWLLDGFPRTKVQAEALVKAVGSPQSFVFIDAPDDILVERVTGRRSDPDTNKVYHLKFNPPPEELKSKLIQRPDDTPEKVKVRLGQFHEHITAVLSYFGDTTTVVKVNGNQDKATIFKQIEQQLG